MDYYAGIGIGIALIVIVVVIGLLYIARSRKRTGSGASYQKPHFHLNDVNVLRATSDNTYVHQPHAEEEHEASGIQTPLPVYSRAPQAELNVEIVDRRLEQAAQLEEGRADNRNSQPAHGTAGGQESLPPYVA